MYGTGLIQKQNYRKVFLLKGSRNMCSKCADANLHTAFVVYIFAAKYVAPTRLILPEKRLNRDVIEGYDIEGYGITTAPKVFINSTLLLI